MYAVEPETRSIFLDYTTIAVHEARVRVREYQDDTSEWGLNLAVVILDKLKRVHEENMDPDSNVATLDKYVIENIKRARGILADLGENPIEGYFNSFYLSLNKVIILDFQKARKSLMKVNFIGPNNLDRANGNISEMESKVANRGRR